MLDHPDTWGGKYKLGELIHGNGSAELKMGEILKECRDYNSPIFLTLKLDESIKVTEQMEFENVNIRIKNKYLQCSVSFF